MLRTGRGGQEGDGGFVGVMLNVFSIMDLLVIVPTRLYISSIPRPGDPEFKKVEHLVEIVWLP